MSTTIDDYETDVDYRFSVNVSVPYVCEELKRRFRDISFVYDKTWIGNLMTENCEFTYIIKKTTFDMTLSGDSNFKIVRGILRYIECAPFHEDMVKSRWIEFTFNSGKWSIMFLNLCRSDLGYRCCV